jgi:uncharacterized protein YggE
MQDFINELGSTKWIRVAAVAALALLALFLLLISIDKLQNLGKDTVYPTKTITVIGEGEATVVPDIARITFTVQETAATVAAAQTAATNRTNQALEAMKAQGVEEKDLKTLGYNVYPQYDYGERCMNGVCTSGTPTITGYQVSQTVEVKVRNTDGVGAVLESLGSLGVQNISGPEFTLDDSDAATDEARAAAIADAREKAKILAKNLGVRLGKVVSFYEDQGAYPYDGYYGKGGTMMEAAAQSAPSLPTGESQTKIRVNITYEIR